MPAIDDVRRILTDLLGGPDATIAHRRQQAEQFAGVRPPLPDGLKLRARTLGGVAVEEIAPIHAAPSPVFLHLHGGGYVMGAPPDSRPFTTELALRAQIRVISVDYRLAPASPFPAAVDDAVAVYRALLAEGVPAYAIAVGGESAGGGLAISLLLAARDAGLPMPLCAVAMSPWANLRCEGASYDDLHGVDPLLTRAVLQEMAHQYLQDAEADHPLASPALARLHGLPPMLIQVGSDEVLLDDARLLAERASAAGVAVTLQTWPGMIHVWHMFHPILPEGGEAIGQVCAFLDARWRTVAEQR